MRAGIRSVVVFFFLLCPCMCWEQEELDLFDLVEEIGENFYELMQLDRSASASEVRRAYRTLSLQLHPDKNPELDAAEKFRKMVAVYEVLKDEVKRSMYDQVLDEGLPDWKQPLFYYRRVRKMGMLELVLLLLGVASVGHYLYGWAVYAEKMIALQDVLSRKTKKEQRKSRNLRSALSRQRLEAEVDLLETQALASIPRLRDTLPVLLGKQLLRLSSLGWSCLLLSLKTSSSSFSSPSRKNGRGNYTQEEEVAQEVKKHGNRKLRRRIVGGNERGNESQEEQEEVRKQKSKMRGREVCGSGSGSENEKSCLNTPSSLHVEQELATDVHTALTDHKAKEDVEGVLPNGELSTSNSNSSEDAPLEASKKDDGIHADSRDGISDKITSPSCDDDKVSKITSHNVTCRGNQGGGVAMRGGCGKESGSLVVLLREETGGWTQYQQKQLEWALGKYPKFSEDRWGNVARAVPGKSQEDCIARCKELYKELKNKRTA